jgi:hypothetical protein
VTYAAAPCLTYNSTSPVTHADVTQTSAPIYVTSPSGVVAATNGSYEISHYPMPRQ